MSDVCILHPHSKLNLGLRILDRRPDGFHDIHTLFQTIDLRDELRIERAAAGFSLGTDRPDLPTDSSNLVLQAAETLRNLRPDLPGARFFLRKRIPKGAGLGGGSSDAAATLIGLDHLWGLGLSPDELAAAASRIGSDVVFFLRGGLALGRGRGEILEPLPDPPSRYVLLIIAPFESITSEAYELWDRLPRPAGPRSPETQPGNGFSPVDLPASPVNDFESLLLPRHPDLSRNLHRLRASGARAAGLSGSGPTLYGLFDDRESAEAVRAGWGGTTEEVFLCRTVSRRDYLENLGPDSPGSSKSRLDRKFPEC